MGQSSARFIAVMRVMCLAAGALLCWPTTAAARVDDDINVASTEVGACFARDDPECAAPWIAKLQARVKGSQAVAYTRGYHALLVGDFDGAAATLAEVAKATIVPASLRKRAAQFGALAAATVTVTAGMQAHELLGGKVVVLMRPGRDEVLLPFMQQVLERAMPVLEAAIGPMPAGPLRIHVYPKVEDLAAVSGLTVAQIRDSGTIALCKYNRLMLTSPSDLLFGYAWADTVAHELVHWLVIRRGGGDVPVWLHEGLARTFEATWRGVDPMALAGDERAALHKARRRKRFISFAQMSPTMAKLPSQADTQLAFAEVHHAFAWMLHRAPREAGASVTARRLIERFGKGDDEAAAIEAWLGMPRKTALGLWRRDLSMGLGPAGPFAKQPVTRPAKLRFKRVPGPDPWQGMGGPARRFTELGDRLLAIERPRAAVIEYRKAIGSGARREPMLLRRLARALLAIGEVKAARDRVQEALAQHPEDPAALVILARSLTGLGQHEPALAAAMSSAFINPYDPQLHEVMATIYTALGDTANSARARQLIDTLQR